MSAFLQIKVKYPQVGQMGFLLIHICLSRYSSSLWGSRDEAGIASLLLKSVGQPVARHADLRGMEISLTRIDDTCVKCIVC